MITVEQFNFLKKLAVHARNILLSKEAAVTFIQDGGSRHICIFTEPTPILETVQHTTIRQSNTEIANGYQNYEYITPLHENYGMRCLFSIQEVGADQLNGYLVEFQGNQCRLAGESDFHSCDQDC